MINGKRLKHFYSSLFLPSYIFPMQRLHIFRFLPFLFFSSSDILPYLFHSFYPTASFFYSFLLLNFLYSLPSETTPYLVAPSFPSCSFLCNSFIPSLSVLFTNIPLLFCPIPSFLYSLPSETTLYLNSSFPPIPSSVILPYLSLLLSFPSFSSL